MLHQFAERLGIGIDVLEQLIASLFPALQPTVELADIAVAQGFQTIRRLRHEALAVIIEHDRHILARQPRFGLQRDPVSRHVGGKQRMAGGEGGLVPDIEQRDFFAQQQRGADFGRSDGRQGHESGIPGADRISMISSIARGPSRAADAINSHVMGALF